MLRRNERRVQQSEGPRKIIQTCRWLNQLYAESRPSGLQLGLRATMEKSYPAQQLHEPAKLTGLAPVNVTRYRRLERGKSA